jgi:hypothetical protein
LVGLLKLNLVEVCADSLGAKDGSIDLYYYLNYPGYSDGNENSIKGVWKAKSFLVELPQGCDPDASDNEQEFVEHKIGIRAPGYAGATSTPVRMVKDAEIQELNT